MRKKERELSIIKDYEASLAVREIAKKHSVSLESMYSILDKHGVNRKQVKFTDNDIKGAVRDCINGMSLSASASNTGCTPVYLSTHVAKEKRRLNKDVLDTLGDHASLSLSDMRDGCLDDRVYMRTNGLITHLVIPVKELL